MPPRFGRSDRQEEFVRQRIFPPHGIERRSVRFGGGRADRQRQEDLDPLRPDPQQPRQLAPRPAVRHDQPRGSAHRGPVGIQHRPPFAPRKKLGMTQATEVPHRHHMRHPAAAAVPRRGAGIVIHVQIVTIVAVEQVFVLGRMPRKQFVERLRIAPRHRDGMRFQSDFHDDGSNYLRYMVKICYLRSSNTRLAMKKLLAVCLTALFATTAAAQTVALGEKVPELKSAAWLDGRQPAAAPLTYVEFFRPSSAASRASLDDLQALSRKFGSKLHIVVLSRDSDEETLALLRPYVSDAMSVGLDASGRIFNAYGIRYAPSGVLVDAKKRAVWMGNSRQVDEPLIRKYLR